MLFTAILLLFACVSVAEKSCRSPDESSTKSLSSKLRVVSYNVKQDSSNVRKLVSALNGEHVICLQDVYDVHETRFKFDEHLYSFHTPTTEQGANQSSSLLILSKTPFGKTESKLIKFEDRRSAHRRYAQYVTVQTSPGRVLHLFHFHNAHNANLKNSQTEELGAKELTKWAIEKLQVPDFSDAPNVIITGQFFIREDRATTRDLLQGLKFYDAHKHLIASTVDILQKGVYYEDSDNPASWATTSRDVDFSWIIGSNIYLRSVYQNEYLYADDDKYAYDGDRRQVFTWRKGNVPPNGARWRLEIVSISRGDFRIFNTDRREYMYAADYAPYDGDRRRVFTWRPGNAVGQGTWRISDHSSYLRVFNTRQEEYLYAADYAPYDNDRRRAFTWQPGNYVNQGPFLIESAE